VIQPLNQNLPIWAEWARRSFLFLIVAWVISGVLLDEHPDWVSWVAQSLFVVLLAMWVAGWIVLRRQRKARGA
jgi:uncharacterized protein involved in response to NO